MGFSIVIVCEYWLISFSRIHTGIEYKQNWKSECGRKDPNRNFRIFCSALLWVKKQKYSLNTNNAYLFKWYWTMCNEVWRWIISKLERKVLNYFCCTANSRGVQYSCSLKHTATKILHHALPFYFFFHFPFSSKKHFPAEKYLADSLEIKIKWPCTLSPRNKHVCFHRKTVLFWHLWIWTRFLFCCREGNWGLKVTLLYREHMDQLTVRDQRFRGTIRNLCHVKKKF